MNATISEGETSMATELLTTRRDSAPSGPPPRRPVASAAAWGVTAYYERGGQVCVFAGAQDHSTGYAWAT